MPKFVTWRYVPELLFSSRQFPEPELGFSFMTNHVGPKRVIELRLTDRYF